jgi:hypothetical protein
MLDNTNATIFVNINGTLKKVSMMSFSMNLSIKKNIITVTSYSANLLIIDESFLLVIFSPNFLAFQIPVIVSIHINTPIINRMPLIGKKNAKHIDISVKSCDCIDNVSSVNCAFIPFPLFVMLE